MFFFTPHLRNEKGSFFCADMVGDSTISMVYLSVDNRYCGGFKNNCGGCIVSFAIRLSRRGALIFLWNLKKDISLFLSSRELFVLT